LLFDICVNGSNRKIVRRYIAKKMCPINLITTCYEWDEPLWSVVLFCSVVWSGDRWRGSTKSSASISCLGLFQKNCLNKL